MLEIFGTQVIMEELNNQYSSYLIPIRKLNSMLLPDLAFQKDKQGNEQRTLERLKLAVALLNNLRPEDYITVRFLFNEELKAKRSNRDDDQQFYNLRLTGHLLSRYKNPEDVWALFEAHTLDEDFEIEHVMLIGVQRIFEYTGTSRHKQKSRLLRKIGSSLKKSKFTQQAVTEWLEDQEGFLDTFLFPLKDELTFASIMQDHARVNELLPDWKAQQKDWTSANALKYVGLAKKSGNSKHEIEALELYTVKYNNTLTSWFKFRLAELYANDHVYDKAIIILGSLLHDTADKALEQACIEKLCHVLNVLNNHESEVSQKALALVNKTRKKYKRLPTPLGKSISQIKGLLS